jgi:hypothetical protein
LKFARRHRFPNGTGLPMTIVVLLLAAFLIGVALAAWLEFRR